MSNFQISSALALTAAIAACATACDFDSQIAPRVGIPVVVDSTGIVPTTTDLGYVVELTRARTAIDTFEFTTDGEMHARRGVRHIGDKLYDVVIPTAYAHPGHDAGGEVVGELTGRFVVDWTADGSVVGDATMLEAHYTGANFTFAQAGNGDAVALDDPLVGHTFDLAGTATIDGQTWTFEALVEQDTDRRVIGLPLDLVVEGDGDVRLAVCMYTSDPREPDTIFDGIEFAALDDDGDGHVVLEPGTDAYNVLRRNLQVHDHYGVTSQ